MAELSKLSDDQELRRIQILVAETEVSIAETKLKLKESDLRQKEWDYRNQSSVRALMRNPIIVGAILITFATIGATIVSYINFYFQQKAEQVDKNAQFELEVEKSRIQAELDNAKHEASLITNAIQHGGGDPDRVAQNLKFLLDTGLIPRTHTRSELDLYLRAREPGNGASGGAVPRSSPLSSGVTETRPNQRP